MNIKELRTKTGLSQSRFAEKYDIPVRTLQQWEQGKSSPAPYVESMIEKLALNDAKPKSYIDNFKLKEKTSWKIVNGQDYLNVEKIHPLQQRKVGELIEEISKNDKVVSIIIFGSSVTDHCHIGSDVDVYVEEKEKCNVIGRGFDFEYDMWDSFTADDRLKEVIKKKGVVVYNAGNDTV